MAAFYALVFIIILAHGVESTQTKGPFTARPTELRKCVTSEISNAHPQYNSFVEWQGEIFNSSGKSYMRGNYTILKSAENIKARVRNFFWEDNQWKIRTLMRGFGCQRPIFRLVARFINLDVKANKCAASKGSVTVPRVDFDVLYHAWEAETDYGRWRWIYEATTQGKSVVCVVLDATVTPINGH